MDVSEAYRGHIGAYRSVSERIGTYQSCQNTPIRELEYRVHITREPHPHLYRIRIQY
jgi:hypothetical protein